MCPASVRNEICGPRFRNLEAIKRIKLLCTSRPKGDIGKISETNHTSFAGKIPSRNGKPEINMKFCSASAAEFARRLDKSAQKLLLQRKIIRPPSNASSRVKTFPLSN